MTAISDPNGTNGTTPSYAGYRMDVSAIAAAAITDKQAVAILMSTDGDITVVPYDTDTHDPATKMGVALEDIASGGVGQICVWGPCVVKTPGTGPSANEVVIGTTTAGVADGLAADATSVSGDSHGVFLTDEIGTSDTAWVWLR